MSDSTTLRLRPTPGPSSAATTPARLRLVGRRTGGAPVPWRVLASGLAIFVVLVGLVALQAVLIGGQRELDRLQGQLEATRVDQNALRREESMLRTPSEIRDLATERLGMVPADLPALVEPPTPVIGTPSTIPPPGGAGG